MNSAIQCAMEIAAAACNGWMGLWSQSGAVQTTLMAMFDAITYVMKRNVSFFLLQTDDEHKRVLQPMGAKKVRVNIGDSKFK